LFAPAIAMVSKDHGCCCCIDSVEDAQLEERELRSELMKQGFKDAQMHPVCLSLSI